MSVIKSSDFQALSNDSSLENDRFFVAQSCRDICEDISDCLEGISEQHVRLCDFRKELDTHCADLPPQSVESILPILCHIESSYETLIEALRNRLKNEACSPTCLEQLIKTKHELRTQIRTLQSLTAALLVSVNWQAPSLDHSKWSQAGTRTGRIIGTQNDYQRDHHPFATAYEKAFKEAFIDALPEQTVRAYTTVSGQAALRLAALSLQYNGLADGNILVGNACSLQNKIFLNEAFVGRVHYIDEQNIDHCMEAVLRYRPSVIFLESVSDSVTLAMPDIFSLISELAEGTEWITSIVLDNTAMATMSQPVKNFPASAMNFNLLVVEAIDRYYQFGNDCVSAGILYAIGTHLPDVFTERMSLGINIPDINIYALPQPIRHRQDARMSRIGRNALHLAQYLHAYVVQHSLAQHWRIVFPGLETHLDYSKMSSLPFHGGVLNIVIERECSQSDFARQFVISAMDEVERLGGTLVCGEGCGFDTTRIEVPIAEKYDKAHSFLRIAVGTESMFEIDRIGAGLVSTMKQLGF